MKIDNKQIVVNSDFDFNNHKGINFVDPTAAQDAATKAYVDSVATGLSWKNPVRVASTANVPLAGGAALSIDGVVLVNVDSVLLKNQTAPADNGIYILSGIGSAYLLTRRVDANSPSELLQAAVFAEEGATNADSAFVGTANAPIVIGVTALPFVKFTSTPTGDAPTSLDKNVTASATAGDNQTSGVVISATPFGGSYVEVQVNGATEVLGDAVKTKDCYFSVDGGATARAIAAITSGDTLYWNGVLSGFNLAITDKINLLYNV